MNQLELSFVLPAYNEESLIEILLGIIDSVIADRKIPYEIIVVDDGSKDKTLSKAQNYAGRNQHVKVLSYSNNVGKGYAVKKGFLNTTGKVVVFTDSDMEIDLRTISKYLDALKYGDIIIASKKHPGSKVEVPIFRRSQ